MFTNAPTMRHFVPCTTVDGVGDVPELWEGENVLFQLRGAQVASSAAAPTHRGALFITSKRVLFLGEDGKTSYDFDVPFITLHAVSRDPATFPRPCVYCQLDCEDLDFTAAEGDEEDEEEEEGEIGQGEEGEAMQGADNEEEEGEEWKELFIVPEEEKDVMAVFEALSQAALLNPDEEEGGGDDDFIYNLDEVRLGAEEARVLNHLESVFQFPDEEGFEGIEEEEETEEDREEERANNMEE